MIYKYNLNIIAAKKSSGIIILVFHANVSECVKITINTLILARKIRTLWQPMAFHTGFNNKKVIESYYSLVIYLYKCYDIS